MAQVPTFAGNAQHTSLYSAPAQNMNQIRWSVSIDQNNTGAATHYGAPLVSAANTVITGVKIAADHFQVSAFDGSSGAAKYTLTTDYVLPSHNWIPVYNPAIVSGPFGTRLYYAGAGGTLFHVDNIDSNSPGAPVREVFYTTLANYTAGASGYNSTIFIDTPITSDALGNVSFGFRVDGTAPAPLSTTQSGYARIDPSGAATYVLAGAAASDGSIGRDCHNTAPALSLDGTTLYVVVKSPSTAYYGYLLGLDSTTLATKYKVFLYDPRNTNPAGILDDGTASPMVAPDGDVFLGVFGNPYNGSRGWLLHFTGDLSVERTPGAFGWDFTPGIVPASMVPSYNGPSSYLLACKYNNYANVTDGNGVNKIAILDPNATQTDFHPTAPGFTEMREVMTIIGVTPDSENPTVPNAIREWCINTPCVNPATNSVFVPSEDGRVYRWNLADNSMSQAIALTAGIGEPYIPAVVGPDGTVYALNGGYLFAIGAPTGVSVTLDSSTPSVRTVIVGDSVTFTANVSSGSGTPTGTVTFTDLTYDGFTPVTTALASNVPLDGSGHASVTVSTLTAGGTFLGNHLITASYSGDGSFSPASMTRMQKVHAYSSATTVTSSSSPSAFGASVTFTAVVSSSGGVATGYVTFLDGANVIGQRPLDGTGTATFATSALGGGSHAISASYYSDTQFAASSGGMTQQVSDGTSTSVVSSPNPSAFGQSVTFTATVSGSHPGTPTGSVTFTDGATTLGTVAVDGTGHAALSTSALSVGSHTVTGSFTGTGGWANSNGIAAAQSVTDGTSTTVGGLPNPSTYGQSVTFTATVSAADAGAGTPTGTVTFKDGASTLGSSAVDGTGHASLSTSSLSFGNHTITANFVGSGGWQDSSGSTGQAVQDGTATAVGTSVSPSTYGTSVTFTATVSPADAGAGTPTGTVTFKDGATTLGSSAVDGAGQATLSTSTLGVGSHTISADFAGSGGWLNSGGSTPQSVQDGTSTTLGASPNPSNFGQSVTFTATVTAADAGAGTPTGTVTFKDGATTLGSGAVDGTGHASLSTSSLNIGSHSITANFVGSGGWLNSGGSVTQTVKDVTPPNQVTGVSTTPGPNKKQITIRWNATTDPDDAVAAYLVYKSSTQNGTFTLLATVTTLSYVDTIGKPGQVQWYYIVARDTAGNLSVPSAKVSGTAR